MSPPAYYNAPNTVQKEARSKDKEYQSSPVQASLVGIDLISIKSVIPGRNRDVKDD
jgi:hypothetical protein